MGFDFVDGGFGGEFGREGGVGGEVLVGFAGDRVEVEVLGNLALSVFAFSFFCFC